MRNCRGYCANDIYAVFPEDFYCCDCPRPPRSCFPSDSKVYLKNGEQRAMSELQIGDQVQAGTDIFTK